MSYFMFGNLAASVPPMKDTTPCMDPMLNYEDCITEADFNHLEVIHPSWPTMFPRLLTDGRLIDFEPEENQKLQDLIDAGHHPLSKKAKQFLWECEHERFVFKACLRKVLGLQKSRKHTSWNTAEVSNLQLT